MYLRGLMTTGYPYLAMFYQPQKKAPICEYLTRNLAKVPGERRQQENGRICAFKTRPFISQIVYFVTMYKKLFSIKRTHIHTHTHKGLHQGSPSKLLYHQGELRVNLALSGSCLLQGLRCECKGLNIFQYLLKVSSGKYIPDLWSVKSISEAQGELGASDARTLRSHL